MLLTWIHKTEEVLAQVFLAMTTLAVFAGGLGRFLGYPLGWSMDLATFCFAWAVFLSADVALRQERHVSVELLARRLPPKGQLGLKLVNLGLIALFLLALLVYGLELAYSTRFRTFQGIPGLSYTWVTLSVPVGSLLLLLTTFQRIQQTYRRLKEAP